MISFLVLLVLGLLFEYCRGIFKLDSNFKENENAKSDKLFLVEEIINDIYLNFKKN
jgi:hypothetical protein